MITREKFAREKFANAMIVALALTLSLTQLAYTRGGGGGHGGGGYGGGRGGDGFRDGGFRDGGDRGSDRGDGGDDGRGFGRNFGDNFGRIDDADALQGRMDRTPDDLARDDAELDREANHLWNQPMDSQRSMATDGGFGRIAGDDARSMIPEGNKTQAISQSTLSNRGNSVRNAFNNNNAFGRNWWNNRDGLWYGPWLDDGWGWGYTGWDGLSGFWGDDYSDAPVEYDYGNNITYQGNDVYYGSQDVGTAEQYYDEAYALAQTTPIYSATNPQQKAQMTKSNWKPMGVFSLVQGNQTDSTELFQIAVGKDYSIHGNYYNTLTNTTKQISGAVDKKTKRAAWTIDGSKDVVYDTGVANLMKAESPILVHFGKNKTEQFELVRLKQNQAKV
ncbi:MAG: hypothetical protein K2Y22_00760 [Candidatus Obscuribacterales bacterium]|nr:hypothetical protein [Candidatus Obscuribacterales bacterium]